MVHLENFGTCVRSEAFRFNKSVLKRYFITRTCISIHKIRQRRYAMHSMDSLSHIFTFSNHELVTQKMISVETLVFSMRSWCQYLCHSFLQHLTVSVFRQMIK